MDESLRGRKWIPETIPGKERVRKNKECGAEGGIKSWSRVKVLGPARGLAGHDEKERHVDDNGRAQAPGNTGPESRENGAADGEAEDEGQHRCGERAVRHEREDVAGVREEEAEEARTKVVGRKHEEDIAEEGEEQTGKNRHRVMRGEAGVPGGDEEKQKGSAERLEDVHQRPMAEGMRCHRNRSRGGNSQATKDGVRQERHE